MQQNALFLTPLLKNAQETRDFTPVKEFISFLEGKLELIQKWREDLQETIEMSSNAIVHYEHKEKESIIMI